MDLEQILHNLGISKVKLSKYLGVSRQMVYNYLESGDINKWPKDKKKRLFDLLNIKSAEDIESIEINNDYIASIDKKLDLENRKLFNVDSCIDMKGLKKEKQELLVDIIYLLKEKLADDDTDEGMNICNYLYHFLQSMDNSKELKYILAYVSKTTGFTDPNDFKFNKDQQLLFEGILFSAMTLYTNGGASKSKIVESHKRFVQDIEHKREEKLSRTQELNAAKIKALKELGYTQINEKNAAEVLQRIAEIQSRTVV